MANSIKPASIADLGTVERIVHDAYVKYTERMGKQPGPMLDDYRQPFRRMKFGYSSTTGTSREFSYCRPNPIICSSTMWPSIPPTTEKASDAR
jgi:hypothetical protein